MECRMNTLFSNPNAYQTDLPVFPLISSPDESRCFVERIWAFFYARRPAKAQLFSENPAGDAAATISTISTPNGPWVYTVVPWED